MVCWRSLLVQLARGTIVDRPWGVTLASIDARRLTCKLSVGAGRSQFGMLFDDGDVIDASSPIMSDSVASIAIHGGFVRATQFGEVTRRIAESPGEDHVDVLAHVVGLAPGACEQLRRCVIEQRAARTFTIEYGGFVVDTIDHPSPPRTRVDVRRVIYLGARLHVPIETLDSDVRAFGRCFALAAGASASVSCFGFGISEQPILDALAAGTSLAELDDASIDHRTSRAVIYALLMCQLLELVPEMTISAPEPGSVAFRRMQTRPDLGNAGLRTRPPAPSARPGTPR